VIDSTDHERPLRRVADGATPEGGTRPDPPRRDKNQRGAAPPSAQALQSLVQELERLPGIGRRTAERLAYHLLKVPREEALRLAQSIRDVKLNIRYCRTCFNITEKEECAICEDAARDPGLICVVEQPKDLNAIEASGSYRGRYHVLLGAFAPLDGVSTADLTLEALVARVRAGGIREVILATNPNFEGDGTALLLREQLKGIPDLKVTMIARGVPTGSHLEHASRAIVADALEGRRELAD
jgi:recombination protein RecR